MSNQLLSDYSKNLIIIILGACLAAFGVVYLVSPGVWKDPETTEFAGANPEYALASEITYDCDYKITTNLKEISITPNYKSDLGDFLDSSRCYQFMRSEISPSNKYIVFDDVLGGVDSALRVHSLPNNDTYMLGVYGTGEVFDFVFLDDDRVAVLSGFEGYDNDEFNTRSLVIYDLGAIFNDYPESVNLENNYMDTTGYITQLPIESNGTDYRNLMFIDGKLHVQGSAGSGAEPLDVFEI